MPCRLELHTPAHEIQMDYGLFSIYREAFSLDVLQVPLEEMETYGGDRPWAEFLENPAVVLLNRPDNSGTMAGYEAERLLPVLRAWRPPPDHEYHDQLVVLHTEFTSMVEQCAEQRGLLTFS